MSQVFAIASVVIGIVCVASAADSVEPASMTSTNIRAEAEETLPGTFFRGTTLLFTNCVVYSDTAGSTTQGLSGVTVTISVGNTSTSTDYDATVISTNDGTWWASIEIPTNITSTLLIQTKLIDSLTNTFIYPHKRLNHEAAL